MEPNELSNFLHSAYAEDHVNMTHYYYEFSFKKFSRIGGPMENIGGNKRNTAFGAFAYLNSLNVK